jgi:pantoate--beta-alanine ligase
MVEDLNFPFKIVVCPTIRAADGLALSSRNRYLSPQQRKDAVCIYRSLQVARKMIKAGVTNSKTITAQMRKIVSRAESLTAIDYISIAEADTLQNLQRITGRVLIAVAARFGSTRLIDNVIVDAPKQ